MYARAGRRKEEQVSVCMIVVVEKERQIERESALLEGCGVNEGE